LLLLLLVALPLETQAQFTYTTNNGTITITEYTGPGGDVNIPDTIYGLPVTSIEGIGGGMMVFQSAFENSSLRSVSVPATVTNIGDAVFYGCTDLATVTLPGGVRSIGAWAFYSCISLTSFTIPINVSTIGDGAFVACYGMTTITVDPANSAYSAADGVLFNKSQSTLVVYPAGKAGSYTIPNGVTSLAIGAFDGCTNLTSATIPSSVTSIALAAFQDCNGVTSIKMPSGVTNIGDFAFYGCTALPNITIPGSVTSVGYEAFAACANLTGVYFQGNAPSFGSFAFGFLPPRYLAPATIYYLPNAGGWPPLVEGVSTVLWNPQVQTSDASFGVRTNQFGFTITGTTNIPIVVEACTNLASASWTPLQTCTLTNGSIYFNDPQWTNYPTRFYRIRSP
jgi:hypothetical protein